MKSEMKIWLIQQEMQNYFDIAASMFTDKNYSKKFAYLFSDVINKVSKFKNIFKVFLIEKCDKRSIMRIGICSF